MPLSINSSRDTLQPLTSSEDRRRTGRYLAVGAVLAVMLLTLHHVLLRDASTIAGVCIPTTIMACYVLWILYSVRRDRRKARLLASAMQVTEVISSEASDASGKRARTTKQMLEYELARMVDTPGKSVMMELPRTREANGIGTNNHKDLGNVIM